MSLYVTTMAFNTVLVLCQFNTMAVALPSRFSPQKTFLIFNGVGLGLLAACGLSTHVLAPDKVIYLFSSAYWVPQIATALFIARQVREACEKAGVRLVEASSMKALGQACGVEVKTASAGIRK